MDQWLDDIGIDLSHKNPVRVANMAIGVIIPRPQENLERNRPKSEPAQNLFPGQHSPGPQSFRKDA